MDQTKHIVKLIFFCFVLPSDVSRSTFRNIVSFTKGRRQWEEPKVCVTSIPFISDSEVRCQCLARNIWKWRTTEMIFISSLTFSYITNHRHKALSFEGAFAKFRKATISFVMSFQLSICPSVRMEELGSPPDRFSWNLVFEHSSKICREYSSFIRTWH